MLVFQTNQLLINLYINPLLLKMVSWLLNLKLCILFINVLPLVFDMKTTLSQFSTPILSSLYNTFLRGRWITDSGGYDLSLFSENFLVSWVTYFLPSGSRLLITHSDKIHLSDLLILHDVLYVLSFKFNFLS